jgi:hypothetical protein
MYNIQGNFERKKKVEKFTNNSTNNPTDDPTDSPTKKPEIWCKKDEGFDGTKCVKCEGPNWYSNYAPHKEQKKDERHRKPCKCLPGAGRRIKDGEPVPIKPDGSHCGMCPNYGEDDSYYKSNFGNELCKMHKGCERGYGSIEFPSRNKDSVCEPCVGENYSDTVSTVDTCNDYLDREKYDRKKYEVVTENGVNIGLRLTKEAKKKMEEDKIAKEKEEKWNKKLELVGPYLRWGCVLIILGIIYKLFIKKK